MFLQQDQQLAMELLEDAEKRLRRSLSFNSMDVDPCLALGQVL